MGSSVKYWTQNAQDESTRPMPTKLLCSEIPRTDSAMLDAMIDAIPDGAELRRRLRRGYRGIAHRYYAETRTAFTIVADGTTAQCFEIVGLTPVEAMRIAAMRSRSGRLSRSEQLS